jgi:hypothetical protein
MPYLGQSVKIAFTEQSQIPIDQYRDLAIGILGQMFRFLGRQKSDNSFSRTQGARVTNFLIPIRDAYIDELDIMKSLSRRGRDVRAKYSKM